MSRRRRNTLITVSTYFWIESSVHWPNFLIWLQLKRSKKEKQSISSSLIHAFSYFLRKLQCNIFVGKSWSNEAAVATSKFFIRTSFVSSDLVFINCNCPYLYIIRFLSLIKIPSFFYCSIIHNAFWFPLSQNLTTPYVFASCPLHT